MISTTLIRTRPLSRRSLVIGLAALMAALGVPGVWQLRDRGPDPFDPSLHIQGIARLPGPGTGPPDLESTAPVPQPVTVTNFADTEMLVVTFDGFLRNLGPGPLDIYGDPNAADPADLPQQRIWDGTRWMPVARPPIRFESADGHNHFHYLQIARYSLWDSAMTTEIAPASKVGFCLVDTIRDDPTADRSYFGDDGNYCRQGAPGATALRMGISPGYSDIYANDLALQWVDVSDVAPGVYRMAGEMDPFGLVKEADETNNSVVFAEVATVVPGHMAKPVVVAVETSVGSIRIKLESDSYGPVGGLSFRLTVPPRHGTIESVDNTDEDSIGPLVEYTPDAGFVGVDTFRFVAFDPTSPYPITPVESVALISVGVDADPPEIAIDGRRATIHTSGILRLGVVSTDTAAPGPVTWAVDGAEAGSSTLGTIDPDGTYHAPTDPIGIVVISATYGSATATVEVEVITPPNQRPFVTAPIEYVPLLDPTDTQEKLPITTIRKGREAGFIVPATDPNGDRLRFAATGLPPGLEIGEWTGFVSGTPTTRGVYVVTFSADDGTTSSSIEVTLTVN